MQELVYAVRDSKSVFNPPFVQKTRGEAIRTFTDLVNDPQNVLLHRYPEDYALYEVAKWDAHLGVFDLPQSGPMPIVTAVDVKRVAVGGNGHNPE